PPAVLGKRPADFEAWPALRLLKSQPPDELPGVLFLDGPVAKPAQGPVTYQVCHVTPGLEHRKRCAAEIAHHLVIRTQTGVGVKVAPLPLTQDEPCSFQPWNGHRKPPEPVAGRQEEPGH